MTPNRTPSRVAAIIAMAATLLAGCIIEIGPEPNPELENRSDSAVIMVFERSAGLSSLRPLSAGERQAAEMGTDRETRCMFTGSSVFALDLYLESIDDYDAYGLRVDDLQSEPVATLDLRSTELCHGQTVVWDGEQLTIEGEPSITR